MVFNAEQCEKACGGDKEFEVMLLDELCCAVRAALPGLESALTGGRLEQVAELAHSQCGSCRTLGAERLGRDLKSLELAARESDREGAEIAIAAVRREFTALEAVLEPLTRREAA